MKSIDYDNFLDHLMTEVYVEIACYKYGMMYPERNILIAMTKDTYYFMSIEDDGSNQYWDWGVVDEGCSICVFDINEYNECLNFKPLTS